MWEKGNLFAPFQLQIGPLSPPHDVFTLFHLRLIRVAKPMQVLEIRPTIKWNKGKALEFLLKSLGYASADDVLPIYIGDDRTDEDAFKVIPIFPHLFSSTPLKSLSIDDRSYLHSQNDCNSSWDGHSNSCIVVENVIRY